MMSFVAHTQEKGGLIANLRNVAGFGYSDPRMYHAGTTPAAGTEKRSTLLGFFNVAAE
jgi:hypothetical protein